MGYLMIQFETLYSLYFSSSFYFSANQVWQQLIQTLMFSVVVQTMVKTMQQIMKYALLSLFYYRDMDDFTRRWERYGFCFQKAKTIFYQRVQQEGKILF